MAHVSTGTMTPLSAKAWRTRVLLLAGLGLAALAGVLLLKPIPQPEAYHAFKDTRAFLGIPNFLNVVSNLPFLIVGLMGLRWLRAKPPGLAAELRAPYAVVFAGLALTAFGSAYYHWAPDSRTLFWDRLPIAVSFMGLYGAVLAERVALSAAMKLLVPLVLFGAGSVLVWHLTNDLRLYAVAQFFPVLTIPLILWLFPAAFSRGGDFLAAIGCYVAAKIFEEIDGAVYGLGQIVSGHTLKHLAAAAGAYWIYRMLTLRQPRPAPSRDLRA